MPGPGELSVNFHNYLLDLVLAIVALLGNGLLIL